MDIDYSLIVYVLGAVAVGIGIPYYFMKLERPIAAIGMVIAFLAIFIFFGLRWFEGMKVRPFLLGGINKNAPWPPQINYCPDFLSMKEKNGKYYCVDTMGVSPSMPVYTSSSDIDTTTPNYLELTANKTASQYMTSFIGQGVTSGLTWEGVYDGISASNVVPPYPGTVTTPTA